MTKPQQFPQYGDFAKLLHITSMIITTGVLVTTIPLVIWRRNHYPLKYQPTYEIVLYLMASWLVVNYLNFLPVFGVKAFPCWLDNGLELLLSYFYLAITAWRPMRLYFSVSCAKLKRDLTTAPFISLTSIQRKIQIFNFLRGKFTIIYGVFLGGIHIFVASVGMGVFVVPFYDAQNPTQGCIYYQRQGGLEDTVNTIMVVFVVTMYTCLIVLSAFALRHHSDRVGVKRGINFTSIVLLSGAIYFAIVRVVLPAIPFTNAFAEFVNFQLVPSTLVFCFGIPLDNFLNVTLASLSNLQPREEIPLPNQVTELHSYLPASDNNGAKEDFKHFLVQTYSIDHYTFLEHVLIFQSLTAQQQKELMAKTICQNFLDPNGVCIDIKDQEINRLRAIINNPQGMTLQTMEGLFDEAVRQVTVYLACSFVRFQETEPYKLRKKNGENFQSDEFSSVVVNVTFIPPSTTPLPLPQAASLPLLPSITSTTIQLVSD